MNDAEKIGNDFRACGTNYYTKQRSFVNSNWFQWNDKLSNINLDHLNIGDGIYDGSEKYVTIKYILYIKDGGDCAQCNVGDFSDGWAY